MKSEYSEYSEYCEDRGPHRGDTGRTEKLRTINLLSLLAGLGLGALSAASPGCAPDCSDVGEYTECTSRSGLRYVDCGSSYEFNDGAHFSGAGAASDYCYCGLAQIECKDGRLASLCNFTPLDGSQALVYDDNTGTSLENGVAKCLGYDACGLITAGCSFGGWYLRCEGNSGTRYVQSNGEVTVALGAAIQGCNPTDDNGEAKSGHCEDAVDKCSELPNCNLSASCTDDTFPCQENYPGCYEYDSPATCGIDPACKWEVY